jgi:hypothetical protein
MLTSPDDALQALALYDAQRSCSSSGSFVWLRISESLMLRALPLAGEKKLSLWLTAEFLSLDPASNVLCLKEHSVLIG